jgi:hypothetical protein
MIWDIGSKYSIALLSQNPVVDVLWIIAFSVHMIVEVLH